MVVQCFTCGQSLPDKLALVAHVSRCVHGSVETSEETKSTFPVRILERKSPVISAIRMYSAVHPRPRIFATQVVSMSDDQESDEKPFKCNMCDKRFSRKLTLTRHIQTHSGIKPFECHICGKRLSRKHVLMQHLKTHSAGDSIITPSVVSHFQEAGSMYMRVDAV